VSRSGSSISKPWGRSAPASIAQHGAEAGAAGNAARWHRRAADWAGLSDPRESLRHWRRVRVRELPVKIEDLL
jgi:hypothetical protein